MSYVNTPPGYYEQFQIGSPLEEGTEGWSKAPWPGWGQNANLIGPKQIAIGATPDGLGAYYSAARAAQDLAKNINQGVGADAPAPSKGAWVILLGLTVLGAGTLIAAAQTLGRKPVARH